MASELRVDKIIPTTGVPTGGGGGIIQMISGSSNTRLERGSNSNTWYNTYVYATITPKFSTSKILIVGNGDVQTDGNTTGGIKFARNNTAGDGSQTNGTILGGTASAGIVNFRASNGENLPATAIYLDSPGTTSAVKYTVLLSRTGGSNSAFLPGNNGHNPYVIYLFEVSA